MPGTVSIFAQDRFAGARLASSEANTSRNLGDPHEVGRKPRNSGNSPQTPGGRPVRALRDLLGASSPTPADDRAAPRQPAPRPGLDLGHPPGSVYRRADTTA